MNTPSSRLGSRGHATSRVYYPAGSYEHPPAQLLQLRVVRSGSSYAKIDLGQGLRTVFTRPGDLLLSMPDSATTFHIEDGRSLTLLQLEPAVASRMLTHSGGRLEDLAPLAGRPFRDALIAEICRRLEDAEFKAAGLGERALTLVIDLLLLRARKHAPRSRRHVLSAKQLQTITDFVDGHLDQALSVERLAMQVGMTSRQFSRAFRETAAVPVYQFVLRRRVEHARALLIAGELSIAEVAQRSGFSHQAHLTRVLRRSTGRTPTQIRMEAANSSATPEG